MSGTHEQLRLPELLAVRLVAQDPGAPRDHIVIFLQLFLLGRPYFATLIGPSDSQGLAVISAAQIEGDFRRSQALFVMDYRVPLKECDPVIEVLIDGSSEFIEWRRVVEGSLMVYPEVREAARTAKNGLVHSARARVDLRTAPQDRFEVTLPVQSA